jgi:hypothetical protein
MPAKFSKRRPPRYALSALLLLALPLHAAAWGNSGHRIIARVADAHLTARTRIQVQLLLGVESLSSVSTEADRRLKDPTLKKVESDWHYVDMKGDSYQAERDCPNNTCAVAKIEEFRKILADPTQPKEKRAEALMFIVHLVGDVHQPLHCYNGRNDNFGADTKIEYSGENPPSLHDIWESFIISYYTKLGLDEDEFVSEIINVTPRDVIDGRGFDKGDPASWAAESHALGPRAYDLLRTSGGESQKTGGVHKFDLEYFDATFPIVQSQLARGGVRLARYLNDIFDPKRLPDDGQNTSPHLRKPPRLRRRR